MNSDLDGGIEQEFLDGQEGELYDALLAHLKKCSTNRWHYDQIDYCWTGKDADLEWHGYQGLHLDRVTDEKVKATVHCGKTVVGDDVCLNTPRSAREREIRRAEEFYKQQAQEIVCGCNYPGEWSGDDWFLTNEVRIEWEVVLNPETGELDAEATTVKLDAAAEKALENWGREMKSMDTILDQIAGWTSMPGE